MSMYVSVPAVNLVYPTKVLINGKVVMFSTPGELTRFYIASEEDKSFDVSDCKDNSYKIDLVRKGDLDLYVVLGKAAHSFLSRNGITNLSERLESLDGILPVVKSFSVFDYQAIFAATPNLRGVWSIRYPVTCNISGDCVTYINFKRFNVALIDALIHNKSLSIECEGDITDRTDDKYPAAVYSVMRHSGLYPIDAFIEHCHYIIPELPHMGNARLSVFKLFYPQCRRVNELVYPVTVIDGSVQEVFDSPSKLSAKLRWSYPSNLKIIEGDK